MASWHLHVEVDTENKWSEAENGDRDYAFDTAGRVTQVDQLISSFPLITQTHTIHYNEEGWVAAIREDGSASKETTYERDYRGLRFTKSGWGGSGTYLYDQQGRLLEWHGPKNYGASCGRGVYAYTIPIESFVYVGQNRVAVLKSHINDPCVALRPS